MFYSIFGVWKWNLWLVRFLVYLLYLLNIKSGLLWVSRVYFPFRWVILTVHWRIYALNLLVCVYIVEMSYECLYLSSRQDNWVCKVYLIGFLKQLIRLMTKLSLFWLWLQKRSVTMRVIYWCFLLESVGGISCLSF